LLIILTYIIIFLMMELEKWSIAHNGEGMVISTNQNGFKLWILKQIYANRYMKWKDYGGVPIFIASIENL